jgi:hypothetical protein
VVGRFDVGARVAGRAGMVSLDGHGSSFVVGPGDPG